MNKCGFPLLNYYANKLIVDHAWVDARRKMVLVNIGGRYFEIELANARTEPIPRSKLDQCDLIPVEHGPTDMDWPLGQEGTALPFRFVLRSSLKPSSEKETWYGRPDL